MLASVAPPLHSAELQTATSEYRPDFSSGWKEEYTYYDPGHVRHGVYRYWFIDIVGGEWLTEESNYRDGRRHGLQRTWHSPEYSNYSLQSETEWEDDTAYDTRTYSTTGTLTFENIWNAAKSGYQNKQWFDDGKPKYVGSYVVDEFGGQKKDGLHTSYHDNGNKASEEEYLEGKRKGGHKTWYRNGNLQSWENYDDSGQSGTQKYWLEDGRPSSEDDYEKNMFVRGTLHLYGDLRSPARDYDEIVEHVGYGDNDYIKDGLYTVKRRSDGLVLRKEEYLNGQRHGLSETWRETGKKEYRRQYRFDALHGRSESYSVDGELSTVTHYKDGKKHGIFTSYATQAWWTTRSLRLDLWSDWVSRTGNVIWQTTYVEDQAHGPEMYLSDSYGFDTVLQHQGNNSKGFACGTWTATFPDGLVYTSEHGACTPLDDEMDPDPGNTGEVQFVEIKGTVSISGGKAGGAVLVIRNGGGGLLQNLTTDASGSYKTFVPAHDVYKFAAEAMDAIGVSRSIDRNDRQQLVVNLELTAVEKAPDNKPVITGITSSSGEIFLAGVSLMNTYTIKIDWRGKSPATVLYTFDRRTQSIPATSDTATLTLDMGSAFKGSPDPRRSRMRFVAVNADGSESAPFYANPVVLPVPAWTTALGGASFGLLPTAKYPAYALDGIYPDPAVKFSISQDTVPAAAWSLWQAIPWFGRGPMGFKETQFSFGLEAKTDGTGSVMGGFQTGFVIMKKELTGMGSAKGLLEYAPNRGLVWKGAEVGVGLGVSLSEKVDISTVIPLLQSAERWRGVGGYIQRFNNAAEIEGTIAPSAAMVFKVAYDEQKGLSFMEAAPEFGVAVSTVLTGKAGSKVKAKIGGGGSGKVIGKIPGDNWIDKVEFELNFQLVLTVWNFTRQFTEKHTFSFPDTTTQGVPLPRPENVELAGFVPMSVNFAQKANYARFVGNQKSAKQAVNANGVDYTTLVMNGFPESDPVIAELNGKTAIAYVHFDPADPALQGN